MRILIVEDELALAQTLRRGLEEERYSVDVVADGREVLDYALAAPYDVIVRYSSFSRSSQNALLESPTDRRITDSKPAQRPAAEKESER